MAEVTGQIQRARPARFRRYPKYRGSGVDWLGEIPAHWDLKRLKDSVARLESGGTPESDNVTYWTEEEDGIAWVAISDMTREFRIRDTAKRITNKGRESKSLRLLPAGTLLYSMYASLGKVALLEVEAVINQAILGIVPRGHEVLRDYLRWWFEFMLAHVHMLSSSNTQDNLSAERVRNMPIVSPIAIEEQRAIADFLDRETAKIDALVARKERLIELLQEKRTALLTRAVTRGLDPNVPMKDSGVEWLGEIPAHWKVKQLKHLLKAKKGAVKTGPFGSQMQSSEMQAGVIKVYNQRSVLDRDFSSGENYISLEKFAELSTFEVFPGDLLVTTRGSIGRCAILPTGAERGVLHPCLMRVQLDQRQILTHFLEIQIADCSIVLDQLRFMSNATTIDVIYSGSLREVWLSVPSPEEQRAIMAFLTHESSRIDALIAKAHEAIDHLKEFRTAIISAAVTGKIDVRATSAKASAGRGGTRRSRGHRVRAVTATPSPEPPA